MALKVTAMVHLDILKEFNTEQKKLYDFFVDIAGYGTNTFITKGQFKEYISNKFKLNVDNAEIDEFFRFAKQGSNDTDPERITAVEHYMNVHAYPVDPIFKNSLISKIVNFNLNTITEIDNWIKRITSVIEDANRVNVTCSFIS